MSSQLSNPSSDPSRPEGYHGFTVLTPRLILRDYTLSDADIDTIFRLRTDPDVIKYITIPPVRTAADAREWIDSRNTQPNAFNFLIALRDSPSTVIGCVGGIRTPEFGYMLFAPYWGKGYATEAMRGSVDAYWRVYPQGMPVLEEEKRGFVECCVTRENAGSIGVVRKLGFEFVKETEESFVEGKVDHLHWYRVGREKWLEGMEGRERVVVKDREGNEIP